MSQHRGACLGLWLVFLAAGLSAAGLNAEPLAALQGVQAGTQEAGQCMTCHR